MLKVRCITDGIEVDSAYILGLSKKDIHEITSKPGWTISVNLKDLEGPNIEIIIMAGETDQSIKDLLFGIMNTDGVRFVKGAEGLE